MQVPLWKWNSRFCEDLDLARKSRHTLLADCVEQGALLFAVLCVMAWLSSESQKPLRRALAAQVMSSSEASDKLLMTIAGGG